MSYIKKIVIVVAMLGLVFAGVKVYGILQIFNADNTAFNNDEAYVYIPTKFDVNIIKNEISPLLKDEESFKTVAQKLGYTTKIKAGKYTLTKGMSNLEIVRTLQEKSDLVQIVLPSREEIIPITKIASEISTQIEASETELYNIIVDTIYPISKGYKISELQYIYDKETYTIPWNTSAEEFRTIVYKSYEKRKKQ